MSEPTPTHPAAVLMNLIITLLTPMFLAAAGNNLTFARQAANETLNAYRAETQSDLITVAKIIGFGLAALTALNLSMTEGLSVTAVLRLHASANASDRAEHRNRQVLSSGALRHRAPSPASLTRAAEPDIDEAALLAEAEEMKRLTAANLARFTTSTPTVMQAPSPADRQDQATWAASAAAETAAAFPTLPPEGRRSAAIWIRAFNEVAKDAADPTRLPVAKPGDLPTASSQSG